MKKAHTIYLILLLTMCNITFSACGDNARKDEPDIDAKPSLVGKWYGQKLKEIGKKEYVYKYYLTFWNDNSFTCVNTCVLLEGSDEKVVDKFHGLWGLNVDGDILYLNYNSDSSKEQILLCCKILFIPREKVDQLIFIDHTPFYAEIFARSKN